MEMSFHANVFAANFAESRPPSASLRHALVAMASDAGKRQSPTKAFAHVKPIADVALAEIEARRAISGNAAARTRLADGAVIGLLHFARTVVDTDATSMVAPVACVALGNYAERLPYLNRPGSLLVVLGQSPEAQRRGKRIADLIDEGLATFGIDVAATTRTVNDCAALAEALPSFLGLISRRRFVAGRYGFFADLSKALSEQQSTPRTMAPAA
jgi:hypothetical protein